MGKMVSLSDYLNRKKVEKFKVYFSYGDCHDPAELLREFAADKGLVTIFDDISEGVGEFRVAFETEDGIGEVVCADFRYNKNIFEVFWDGPRTGEIIDIFLEHLNKKGVPWKNLNRSKSRLSEKL